MYALDTVCDAIVQPVLGSGWLRSETHNANACCKKKKKKPNNAVGGIDRITVCRKKGDGQKGSY